MANDARDKVREVDTRLSNRADGPKFLPRIAVIAAGAVVGGMLLSGLAGGDEVPTLVGVPTLRLGETVSPDDPRIEAGPVEFARTNLRRQASRYRAAPETLKHGEAGE